MSSAASETPAPVAGQGTAGRNAPVAFKRATAVLGRSQERALGLTMGGLYIYYAGKGILTDIFVLRSWNWACQQASTLAWVPGLLAFLAYLVGQHRLGRIFFGIEVFSYPVAVWIWPLVCGPDPSRTEFWIHQFPGLAALSAVLVFSPQVAYAMLFLAGGLVEFVLWRLGLVVEPAVFVVRTLFTIMFSGYFLVLGVALTRSLGRYNEQLDLRAAAEARETALRSRDREIARLERLTHDHILSLLSFAAEGVGSEKLMVQAQAVNRQLEHDFGEPEESEPITEVVERITARIRQEGVPVHVKGDPGEGRMPRLAAVELESAVNEAVRNSLRHAGPCTREVRIRPGATRLLVLVADDGAGFDPEVLNDGRLGVRHSILTRMNSMPDGFAKVETAPGVGTRVLMRWGSR